MPLKRSLYPFRKRPHARLEQKGVDTWIAVDVLSLAFRDVFDIANIITGDLDLYPLFEALQQTKARGRLISEKRTTSDELRFSADTAEEIDPYAYIRALGAEKEREYHLSIDYSAKLELDAELVTEFGFGEIYRNQGGEYVFSSGEESQKFGGSNLGCLLLAMNSSRRMMMPLTAIEAMLKELD